MNKLNVIALSTLLSLGASAVQAESPPLNEVTPRVIPVLVQVNAMGKVTNVLPSARLTQKLDVLLRNSVDKLVSGPATVKGNAVSSQFILNLALQTTPSEQGKYTAQFAYLSSTPVPDGSWYWVHTKDHRLALAQRSPMDVSRQMRPALTPPNPPIIWR